MADGRGAVFVNLEDSAEIARVDATSATVTARHGLPGCEAPHALAIDPATRRLFSACANAELFEVDADTGRVLGRAPIGRGADAVVFDPATSRVLAASAEGFVTVLDVTPDGAFGDSVTVPTRATGRTMALDPATGALLVPAAELEIDWGARRASFAPAGLTLHVFVPATP